MIFALLDWSFAEESKKIEKRGYSQSYGDHQSLSVGAVQGSGGYGNNYYSHGDYQKFPLGGPIDLGDYSLGGHNYASQFIGAYASGKSLLESPSHIREISSFSPVSINLPGPKLSGIIATAQDLYSNQGDIFKGGNSNLNEQYQDNTVESGSGQSGSLIQIGDVKGFASPDGNGLRLDDVKYISPEGGSLGSSRSYVSYGNPQSSQTYGSNGFMGSTGYLGSTNSYGSTESLASPGTYGSAGSYGPISSYGSPGTLDATNSFGSTGSSSSTGSFGAQLEGGFQPIQYKGPIKTSFDYSKDNQQQPIFNVGSNQGQQVTFNDQEPLKSYSQIEQQQSQEIINFAKGFPLPNFNDQDSLKSFAIPQNPREQQSPQTFQPNDAAPKTGPVLFTPQASLGSGGLGVVELPNGKIVLGSGSLDYVNNQQNPNVKQNLQIFTAAANSLGQQSQQILDPMRQPQTFEQPLNLGQQSLPKGFSSLVQLSGPSPQSYTQFQFGSLKNENIVLKGFSPNVDFASIQKSFSQSKQ